MFNKWAAKLYQTFSFNGFRITLKQLFPETLDSDGNDLSLMSGAEWEIMITYAKTRKYLVEKYPQSQEEARISRL